MERGGRWESGLQLGFNFRCDGVLARKDEERRGANLKMVRGMRRVL